MKLNIWAHNMMIFDKLVILVALTVSTFSTSFYDIPAYYGHFSLNFFQPDYIKRGKLVRLEYHFAVDASYNNETVYYASQYEHCVYRYSVATQTLEVMLGLCGSSGSITGSKNIARFNGISSLAYFQTPSSLLLTAIQQEKVVITADQTCELSSANCILNQPYPQLKMENLRFTPNDSLYLEEGQKEYLYLADTNNHCIKRFSPSENQVTVVAGICGMDGFQDGPLGYNQLKLPRNLGVSRQGVVYFFDSGNEYLRVINLSGGVSTLLLGACKKLDEGRVVAGLKLPQIVCYQDWVEGVTQSPISHFFDPSLLSICTSQSSQCSQ